MEGKLERSVKRYGGKNGGLHYIRTHHGDEQLAETVVPMVLFSIRDKFTRKMFDELSEYCAQFETNQVIIRTSDRTDMAGMVDVMPSEDSYLDFETIQQDLNEIRQECKNKRLMKFSKFEGGDYNPDRVTISIAPKMHQDILTVTEHPNQEERYYFDVGFYDQAIFPKKEGEMLSAEVINDFEAIMGIIEKTRALFPPEIALQWEIGVCERTMSETSPKLFQVRYLGPKKNADFEVENPFPLIRPDQIRCFGVTPKEGLVLRLANTSHSHVISIMDFEKDNPGDNYILAPVNPGHRTHPVNSSDRMVGYFPLLDGHSNASSHIHTRPIQRALNNGGFAILATEIDGEKTEALNDLTKALENARSARVICNGIDFEVRDVVPR
jgi:hypothetical protein